MARGKYNSLVLMGLTLVAANNVEVNSTADDINSIVDNIKITPAYLDWNLGITLTEAKDYIGFTDTKNYIGYVGYSIITTWQKFYLQKSRYQKQQLGNKILNATNNGTVTVRISGHMWNKWKYESTTNCNALVDKPSLDTDPKLNKPSGLGLLPITCGIVDKEYNTCNNTVVERIPNKNFIQCNVVYRQGILQNYDNASRDGRSVKPIQTLGRPATGGLGVPRVLLPISRDTTVLDSYMVFEEQNINISSLSDVYIPEAEHMNNGTNVTVTLNSFKGMKNATMCPDDTVKLVLPIGGMLLDGALLYCFDFEDRIIVTTNMALRDSSELSLTNCRNIEKKRSFKLVLYDGGSQRDGRNFDIQPIQYLYNINITKDSIWDITCTSMYYQTGLCSDWNGWSQMFFVRSSKYLWEYVDRCMVGCYYMSGTANCSGYNYELPVKFEHTQKKWINACHPIAVSLDWNTYKNNPRGLYYNVDVRAGFANLTEENGYRGPNSRSGGPPVLYPYANWESVGSLEQEYDASEIMKITTLDTGEWCVWKSINRSCNHEVPTWPVGDGAAALADSIIKDLVQLGINSGYGTNNVPTIHQLTNDMSTQFSAYTLAASINAAMTGIVAAYGANVFTLKVKFLEASDSIKVLIRVIISVIEVALADVSVIAYMVALHEKGTANRIAQWYNIQMSQKCSSYEMCNSYIYTTANIKGKTDHWLIQWIILVIASAIITILIMYRWHFSKGGTRSDWIEIVKEEAKEEARPTSEIATQWSRRGNIQLPEIRRHNVMFRKTKSAPYKTSDEDCLLSLGS